MELPCVMRSRFKTTSEIELFVEMVLQRRLVKAQLYFQFQEAIGQFSHF